MLLSFCLVVSASGTRQQSPAVCFTEQINSVVSPFLQAYGTMRNYLRTLPAHPSQEEVNNTAEYSDFAYKMAVSYDFRQYILAQGPQPEVLEPASLREDMKSQLVGMLKRYDE